MSLSGFDALAARLTRHAQLLAKAAAQRRRNPIVSWRNAHLIWPLFPPRNIGD